MKINVTKVQPTVNQQIDFSIHKIKGSTDLILESKDKMKRIKESELSNYLKIDLMNFNTQWVKMLDNEWIKLKNKCVYSIRPLFEEKFRFIKLNIITNFHTLDQPVSKNIKQTEIIETFNKQNLILTMCIPTTYVLLEHVNDNSKIKSLFMQINNKFYKWVFGNVSSSNIYCYGSTIFNSNTLQSIYINVVDSKFNSDYGFNFNYDITNSGLTTIDKNELFDKISKHKQTLSESFYILSAITEDEFDKIIDMFIEVNPFDIL